MEGFECTKQANKYCMSANINIQINFVSSGFSAMVQISRTVLNTSYSTMYSTPSWQKLLSNWILHMLTPHPMTVTMSLHGMPIPLPFNSLLIANVSGWKSSRQATTPAPPPKGLHIKSLSCSVKCYARSNLLFGGGYRQLMMTVNTVFSTIDDCENSLQSDW